MDLLSTSLVRLRQDQQQSSTDFLPNDFSQYILEAIVTNKIDTAEVFQLFTNFLLDYKVQETQQSPSQPSKQIMSSSTSASTCREKS